MKHADDIHNLNAENWFDKGCVLNSNIFCSQFERWHKDISPCFAGSNAQGINPVRGSSYKGHRSRTAGFPVREREVYEMILDAKRPLVTQHKYPVFKAKSFGKSE